MKLWRISNYADLRGIGGLKTPARWHNRGIPVVYLAESPALAMLEILVHFDMEPNEVPTNYQLLEVEYGGRKGLSRLDIDSLPDGWQNNLELTRAIGDEWLSGLKSALLKVPSAIIPHSYNYLFNPRHDLAVNARVVNSHNHPFDSRFIDPKG
ncbi:MAG TPA: RES domain-containing protein [Porticoccus sp.]|nr:RES domain-containing protein [Porticoccus sp.]